MYKEVSDRSILYNLSPIGVNTINVESLTSYVMRLSYEHNITVGSLINKLVIPNINKEYLMTSSTYGGNRFYEGAKTINGFKESSNDILNALEILTARRDLSYLTLNKWGQFIPLRNLLKENLSWCPECIRNWQNGFKPYYPLLWYLRVVKVCLIHNCYLVDKCQVCNKKVDILRRNMVPGLCSNCFSPLSIHSIHKSPVEQEVKWQRFVIDNIEDLFIDKPYLPLASSHKEQVINNLNFINETFFSGSISHFSKFLNIPKTTLFGWVKRKNFPSFENLLSISFKLNKKILDLIFERDVKGGRIFQINDQIIVNRENKSCKPFDLRAIEKRLEDFLLAEVALSMNEVARRIGHDKRVLYNNFPNYCKRISKRYQDFIKQRSSERVVLLKEKIDRAFLELIKEGIYPSRRKIEEKAQTKGLLREKALQVHWKNSLKEHGFV